MNLHQIDDAMRQLLDEGIDRETGEVYDDDRLKNLLIELGMDREDKILNCARYMNEQLSMSTAIKAEEDRLAKRRKQHEKRAEFLKLWVEQSCKADEVFESPDIKVSFRQSTRMDVRDLAMVPPALVEFPPLPAPRLNKAGAKRWMKQHDGEPPPGVEEIKRINMQVK